MNILVIDDRDFFLKYAESLLKEHKVFTAASIPEAMPTLKKHDIELVFCDLHMPPITFEVILRFLDSVAAIPVVIVSADVDHEYALDRQKMAEYVKEIQSHPDHLGMECIEVMKAKIEMMRKKLSGN